MSSETLILLTPKTQSYQAGASGFDSLTPAMVAAALAGTNTIGRLLILYRICGTIDRHDLNELHNKTLMYFHKNNWLESIKESRNKTIKRFTELCMREYADKQPICGTCRGNQWLYTKICPTCKGLGRGRYKNAHRAAELAVSRRTYGRTWEPRREKVIDYYASFIPNMESAAERVLYQQLRRD